MSHEHPTDPHSIPVGKLVSVSGKKHAAAHAPHERKHAAATDREVVGKLHMPSQPAKPPHGNAVPARSRYGKIKAVGVVSALSFFALLGTWFAPFRAPGQRPIQDTPGPVAESVVDSSSPPVHPNPSPSVVHSSRAFVPMIDEPATLPVATPHFGTDPETIAVLPREIPPEGEVIVFDTPPVVAIRAPVPPPPTPQPTKPMQEEPLVIIPKPRGDLGLNALGRDLVEKKDACERYGTKIDFLPSPAQANDRAKTEKNKLVMVLHIAGNFEEKGFT